MAKFLLSDIFIGNYAVSQHWGSNPKTYAQFGQDGHNGWDFIMPNGTLIISPADGECIGVYEQRDAKGEFYGFGRYCKILHKQNNAYFVTVYAHLQSVEVSKGQQVKKFQLIAKSDNNGFSSAPHLHFGVHLSDAQGNKIEENGFGGYHDPGDTKVFEWKIENPSKPYEPTVSESMGITEDAQRALDLLEKFRKDKGHGNLEGAINALLGADRDLATALKDKSDLQKKVTDLSDQLRDRDTFIEGQNGTITTLQKQQLEMADLLGVANDYPTLNGEIKKLITVEDDVAVLRTQLSSLKDSQGQEIGKIVADWSSKNKTLQDQVTDLTTENKQLKAKRNLDKYTDSELITIGFATFGKKVVNFLPSLFNKIFRRGGDKK